ncbi:hypothetical protein CR513_51613, partial [Mucuna pruriens]
MSIVVYEPGTFAILGYILALLLWVCMVLIIAYYYYYHEWREEESIGMRDIESGDIQSSLSATTSERDIQSSLSATTSERDIQSSFSPICIAFLAMRALPPRDIFV